MLDSTMYRSATALLIMMTCLCLFGCGSRSTGVVTDGVDPAEIAKYEAMAQVDPEEVERIQKEAEEAEKNARRMERENQ